MKNRTEQNRINASKVTSREEMYQLITLFREGKISWKAFKDIFAFEYRVLNNKNQLIYCPTHPSNRYYRHLTLFPAWRMEWTGKGSHKRNQECFINFLLFVGPAPTAKHQLDRIDNNLGYLPENVRWTTRAENCRNRRNSIKYMGVPLMEVSERTGINYVTLFRRLKEGRDLMTGKSVNPENN